MFLIFILKTEPLKSKLLSEFIQIVNESVGCDSLKLGDFSGSMFKTFD